MLSTAAKIPFVIAVCLFVGSCAGERKEAEGSPVVGISYKPPLVPIVISLTSEGLSVSIEGSVQTPLGTFSAFGQMTPAPGAKVLEIALGSQIIPYMLDGRAFEIELPNDLRGQSRVSYDGHGNIRVIIPNPKIPSGAAVTGDGGGETPPLWYVVTLRNTTLRDVVYTITGDGEAAQTYSLAPGGAWTHWFASPDIDLYFDGSFAAGDQTKQYRLEGDQQASDPWNGSSKVYEFTAMGDDLDIAAPSE